MSDNRKICLACRAPITRIVPLPPSGGPIGLPPDEYCFDCAGIVDLVVAAAPKRTRPWLRLMLRTLFRRIELLEEERTVRERFRKRKANGRGPKGCTHPASEPCVSPASIKRVDDALRGRGSKLTRV